MTFSELAAEFASLKVEFDIQVKKNKDYIEDNKLLDELYRKEQEYYKLECLLEKAKRRD